MASHTPKTVIFEKCGKLVMTRDGKPTFYCMMLDITVQHMAKEELRLSLERHEIIMNQATDIIFDWDIRKLHTKFLAISDPI